MSTSPAWRTEEHDLFADAVTKFYQTELVPNMEKWREQHCVDRAFWNKAAEGGILAATIPEEYGGIGAPMSFDLVSIYEHANTGDVSWGYSIQSIVTHYICAYGTEEQKQRWLPKMATGEIVAAIAMTEPGTGSDLQSVKTYAEKDGNQYRINA